MQDEGASQRDEGVRSAPILRVVGSGSIIQVRCLQGMYSVEMWYRVIQVCTEHRAMSM
jgi:hypothetical protein